MGVIISSFPGCGKSYLMNTHGDKAKMLDAVPVLGHEGEPTDDTHEYDYGLFVDAVMRDIDKYDIVFIYIYIYFTIVFSDFFRIFINFLNFIQILY